MNKLSPNLAVRQRPFDGFLEQAKEKDKRPHPLIVSEKWQFPLTYVDTDNDPDNYLYCARDWYMGLGGTKGFWSKNKSKWLFSEQPVMLETKRERRPIEKLEYINSDALFRLASKCLKFRHIASWEDLLNFEESSLEGHLYIVGMNQYKGLYKIGIALDVQKRMVSIRTSNPFDCYYEMTFYHKRYKQIEEILHKLLADKNHSNEWFYLVEPELEAIKLAIPMIAHELENRPSLMTDEEMLACVKQCARIVSVSAKQLAEYAGVDLLSDKPLLGKGR